MRVSSCWFKSRKKKLFLKSWIHIKIFFFTLVDEELRKVLRHHYARRWVRNGFKFPLVNILFRMKLDSKNRIMFSLNICDKFQSIVVQWSGQRIEKVVHSGLAHVGSCHAPMVEIWCYVLCHQSLYYIGRSTLIKTTGECICNWIHELDFVRNLSKPLRGTG